jgi:hypothetical protein
LDEEGILTAFFSESPQENPMPGKSKLLLLSVFLLIPAFLPAAAPETSASAAGPPYPVWPIPREIKMEEERLLLNHAVIVVPEGDRRAQFPGRLLAELIADQFMVVLPVAVGKAPAGKTPIFVGEVSTPLLSTVSAKTLSRSSPGPEGYWLQIGSDRAVIAGCDYRGTLYGVSSFIQLVHFWGHQSVAVWQATVRDWPFLPLRWVHVYVPGKEMLPFARRYFRDFLLRYKFNGMIMELGGGVRLDRHPEIGTGWQRTVSEWYAHGETILKIGEGIPLGTANRFAASCHFGVGGGSYIEKEELRSLASLAADYGLEITPEIQSLTHVYYLASVHRELAEDPDMSWPDSYCPSNPESYKLLFEVMDEYIDLLDPQRVHIGHDEWRAGAFCPRCQGKDPGELFAQDVLKIQRHLQEKGIETWMWGDHYVDWHNRFGRKNSEGGVVRYEHPDTRTARDLVAAGSSQIHITNWSGERGDATFKKLGWKFILGNFAGTEEKDWPGRVERGGLLGGEISSWCAVDEFELGKLNIPEAAYTINLLWSSHYPQKAAALEQVGLLMPKIRRNLAAMTPPSLKAHPMRFEVLDLRSAFNHPPTGKNWDLSQLKVGRGYYSELPYEIVDPEKNGGRNCILAGRLKGDDPQAVSLPVQGRWASLIFLQTATDKGRESIHAGDQTHFPRESSELLGFYEIRFSDGLVLTHEIRYDETLAKWETSFDVPYYLTRAILAGSLPDGRPAVLWASEWKNPRPDIPIVSLRLVGSPGPSAAQPILFGITAVEKPKVEDYR